MDIETLICEQCHLGAQVGEARPLFGLPHTQVMCLGCGTLYKIEEDEHSPWTLEYKIYAQPGPLKLQLHTSKDGHKTWLFASGLGDTWRRIGIAPGMDSYNRFRCIHCRQVGAMTMELRWRHCPLCKTPFNLLYIEFD